MSSADCWMLVLLRGPHLIDGSGGFGRNHSRLVDVAAGLLAQIGSVARDLVEAADRVVRVGDEEHVVRHPAVVEPVGPHAGHAALGHLHHFVLREQPPLVDGDRIDLLVVGPGAGRGVEIGLRLVQVVQDRSASTRGTSWSCSSSARGTGPCRRGCCRARRTCPSTSAAAAPRPPALLVEVVGVDLLLAAVDFDDRRDERDDVVADLPG